MSKNYFTLPSEKTAKEFGKVNICRHGQQSEVQFTILMELQGQAAEGWKTGVALDASASMKDWYGRMLEGEVPPQMLSHYEQQGWVKVKSEDGRTVQSFQRAAYEDAIQRGYLRSTENIVQPLAREFISYLAGNLDAQGGSTVIYWAGGNGEQVEVLGDFSEQQCREFVIQGASEMTFGVGTKLVPALRYFLQRFPDAKRGMYVFITDGKLDDLAEVKEETRQLASAIASGQRNLVKCILIGVGDAIHEQQMLELDNLETGTNLDIWDHKIAKTMRDMVEIFAEVVDENQIVAPTGTIYDDRGNIIKRYTDGLPAKINFTIPTNSQWFELEVLGQNIRQILTPQNAMTHQN
ncbi:hypothetical protein PN462_08440 [Spirulina sp. CS-785/01]|uniref:hypothetical protein n=1 Tax=Spirulina sp. CS-785/01 TaxID=3021716 RepID=UPI00232D84D1|nr:hypothetical protein [Spirulina sp. CS-785/01]MDB9313127.1 hypothetical protein [Spirulina sp. CS-785/01]